MVQHRLSANPKRAAARVQPAQLCPDHWGRWGSALWESHLSGKHGLKSTHIVSPCTAFFKKEARVVSRTCTEMMQTHPFLNLMTSMDSRPSQNFACSFQISLIYFVLTSQVISHYQCKEQRDAHRFEKISNIIKQFKLSCRWAFGFCFAAALKHWWF